MSKLIFIFLDGFGMGEISERNPFLHASMPFLKDLLGGPLIRGKELNESELMLKGIDACLGVEGVPQSATGQTALFTGVNAAKALGYHLPAFPNSKLKEIIDTSNIMKKAVSAGKRAAFANSYSPAYFEMVTAGKREHSVTTLCMLASGLPFKTLEDLSKGQAVHWDIINKSLNEKQNINIPIIQPEEAGRFLANISENYDLVVYESFLSDLIGHKFDILKAIAFLEMLDSFISGVFKNINKDVTVVITSDHGNIEEIGNGGHTLNPVPLLAFGKNAVNFSRAESILDIPNGIFQTI